MHTKIQKRGNSQGREIDLSVRRGELVVKPAGSRKYRLEDLVRQMTSKNIHAEVDAGAPAGREVW